MTRSILSSILIFAILPTPALAFNGPGGPGGGDNSGSQGGNSGSQGGNSDTDDSDDGDFGGNNQEGSEADNEDPGDDGVLTPLFEVLYADSSTEGTAYGWDRHWEYDSDCDEFICPNIEVWDEMDPTSFQLIDSQGGLNGEHFTGIDIQGEARQESAYPRQDSDGEWIPVVFSKMEGYAWTRESYDTNLLVGVNLLAHSRAEGFAKCDHTDWFNFGFEGFGWGDTSSATTAIIQVNAPVRVTLNRSSSSDGYQHSGWSQTVTRLEWNQTHTALDDVEVLFMTGLESSEYETVHHGPTSDGVTFLDLPEGVYKFECSTTANAVATYDPDLNCEYWDSEHEAWEEYLERYEEALAHAWSDTSINLDITFELIDEGDDWYPASGYGSADFNQDGEVDGADMALILGGWGTDEEALDLSGNGIVDGADLALLLGEWN